MTEAGATITSAHGRPAPASPLRSRVFVALACALGVCAGLLPWPWVLGAAAVVLAMLDPAVALCWLVLSVTAQDTVRLAGGLSLTQLAVPLAAASWGARVLAHPGRRLGLGRTAAMWGLLLTALLVAASLSPYSPGEGLKELWRWGAALLAWLVGATMLRRPWQFVAVCACLLAAPVVNAGLGLAQFAAGDGPPAFRISAGLPYVRAYGTIGQPNSFAGYMNLAWPLALALALGTTLAAWRSGRRSAAPRVALMWLTAIALWLATGVLLAALGASFSRGAWLGAAAGLLGMLIGLGGRAAWLGALLALGAALFLALGGAQLLPAALAERLASITRVFSFFDPSSVAVTPENFAVVERMAQLWAGWKMWLAHPLVGVGPGSYALAYQEFTAGPWFASRGHAHNFYLHIAAEAGLIGLASYLALLGSVAADLRAGMRRLGGTLRGTALLGICGMIAAMAGHNLFENLHVLHLSVQSAAAWGMAAALARPPEGTN